MTDCDVKVACGSNDDYGINAYDIQVSEMGDSGRGQSLMYGDAEEDDLQEPNKNAKTEINRNPKTEINRNAKTGMYGDAEEDDLKPQDKGEKKVLEDTAEEKLQFGDKNAEKKLFLGIGDMLPQDEANNVTEEKESINLKQEETKSGPGEGISKIPETNSVESPDEKESQQPVKEIVATIESRLGEVGMKDIVPNKDLVISANSEQSTSPSQDSLNQEDIGKDPNNALVKAEANESDLSAEDKYKDAEVISGEETTSGREVISGEAISAEASSLDPVSSLTQDASSLPHGSLALQDNTEGGGGSIEKESRNVEGACSPVDLLSSAGKVQKIEIDEVSDRPQGAAQNGAECAENVKPADLGPPPTSASLNVKHDQDEQEVVDGGIKDKDTERDESQNQDTESENNDQTRSVEDPLFGKGFGQESSLNLTKDQEVSGWLDKSFDIKDGGNPNNQVVSMMGLMVEEDNDGIVDYDDVVYEDRQSCFVDGTLSSMEEFPTEKPHQEKESNENPLHILAGLGTGRSIRVEDVKKNSDEPHTETSDLEASDSGESSSAGQLLLFEKSESVAEVGSGSNQLSTRDPPMESGIGSQPVSGRSSYKSAESGDSRPDSSQKRASHALLRPSSGNKEVSDILSGNETSATEEIINGEKKELLEKPSSGTKTSMGSLIVEGTSATLFEKISGSSSAKKSEEVGLEIKEDKNASTDQMDSLLQFEKLEASVADELDLRPTSAKQKTNGSSESLSSLRDNQKDKDGGASGAPFADEQAKGSSRPSSGHLIKDESEIKGETSRPTSSNQKAKGFPRPSSGVREIEKDGGGSRPTSARRLIEKYASSDDAASETPATSMNEALSLNTELALAQTPSTALDHKESSKPSSTLMQKPTMDGLADSSSAKDGQGSGSDDNGDRSEKASKEDLATIDKVDSPASRPTSSKDSADGSRPTSARDVADGLRPNSEKDEDHSSRTSSASNGTRPILEENKPGSRPTSAKTETEEGSRPISAESNIALSSTAKNDVHGSRPCSAKSNAPLSRPTSAKNNDEGSRPTLAKSNGAISATAMTGENESRPTTARSDSATVTGEQHPTSAESNIALSSTAEQGENESRPNSAIFKLGSRPTSAESNGAVSVTAMTHEIGSRPSSANDHKEELQLASAKTEVTLSDVIKSDETGSRSSSAKNGGYGSRANSATSTKERSENILAPSDDKDTTKKASRPSSAEQISTPSSTEIDAEQSRPSSAKDSNTGSRPPSGKEQGSRPQSANQPTTESRPTSAKESTTESRPSSVIGEPTKQGSRPQSGTSTAKGSRPTSANNKDTTVSGPSSGMEPKPSEQGSRPSSAKESATETKSRPSSAKEASKQGSRPQSATSTSNGSSSAKDGNTESRPSSGKEASKQESRPPSAEIDGKGSGSASVANTIEHNSRPTSAVVLKDSEKGSRPQSGETNANKESRVASTAGADAASTSDQGSRPSSAKANLENPKLKEETLLMEENNDETSRPTSAKSSKLSRPSSPKEVELDVSRPTAATTQPTEVNPETKDEDTMVTTNPDLSSEDLKRIEKLFNLFDEDNSGSMSSAELGKLMRSLGILDHHPHDHLDHPHDHHNLPCQECSQRTLKSSHWSLQWTRTRADRLSCLSLFTIWDCRSSSSSPSSSSSTLPSSTSSYLIIIIISRTIILSIPF